jgi:hypothetical protein
MPRAKMPRPGGLAAMTSINDNSFYFETRIDNNRICFDEAVRNKWKTMKGVPTIPINYKSIFSMPYFSLFLNAVNYICKNTIHNQF